MSDSGSLRCLKTWANSAKSTRQSVGSMAMQAAVEVRFADHRWHVAVLVEEPAGLLDVAAEEGRGHQGDGHHLGGGQRAWGSSRWLMAFKKSSHKQ